MKRITTGIITGALAITIMLLPAAQETAEARSLIIKGGWAQMYDDYSNANYNDTWTMGIFFDMGSFIFNKLIFKPGLDYLEMDHKDNSNANFEIWGIHLDWYYYFTGKSGFSPFLGFGAALNYYDWNDRDTNEADSDAGLELFAGADVRVSGPVSLGVEVRYCMNDIANREQNMGKVLLAFIYDF